MVDQFFITSIIALSVYISFGYMCYLLFLYFGNHAYKKDAALSGETFTFSLFLWPIIILLGVFSGIKKLHSKILYLGEKRREQ